MLRRLGNLMNKKRQNNMPSCKKCGKGYTDIEQRWCKPCQINNLKGNLTNWTSGNEKIDNFIQEKQLKIDKHDDIVFEWIPYNQFGDVKEIGRGGFATVYSAIWKDGPLKYDYNSKDYAYNANTKVALKCLNNLQDISNEFLNE